MKTGVVLSAYCGEKYLSMQLDSIVNQSRLPDELVIIDDCSPDDGKTMSIAKQYSACYKYIRVHKNEHNMGWEASFMNGLSLLSPDIEVVFFCDQDDIWASNKIEIMMDYFESTSINALISACQNTDEKLHPIKTLSFSGRLIKDKYIFDNHFIYPKGVGAAMGLRMAFVNKYKAYWNAAIGHDLFFQIMAVMFDTLYFLDKPLILHRFHATNATGKKSYDRQSRIKSVLGNIQLLDMLQSSGELEGLSDKKQCIIRDYRRFASNRLSMLDSRSIWKWVSMPRYGLKYYPTNKTWFGDYLARR